MQTDNESLTILEFEKIRTLLQSLCTSEGARELAGSIHPAQEREQVLKTLNQTSELRQLLGASSFFPDTEFEDFRKEASLLSLEGSVLTEEQFLLVQKSTETANTLVRFLKGKKQALPYLSELSEDLDDNRAMVEAISRIIDFDATVKSSASRELSKIRKDISDKRRESDKRFYNYVNELRKLGYLRDNEEGFYNGRRTLAVLSDYKGEVPGFVHSKSESGKTIFIEPGVTITTNNEVAELEIDERREVLRLLRELSEEIRPYAGQLRRFYDLLVQVDFLRAKARMAMRMQAELPEISETPGLQLQEARHPLLYLQNVQNGKKTVPLSIKLNKDNRIIVISGPNAGGKSITLKTVGLLQLMLQSGLLVPLKANSIMGFFDVLLVDIGDAQSVEQELSTYSARLKKMNFILEHTSERSLLLMDEFGSGTDPELGGAIAEVMLEEIVRSKTLGIITTHYTNVKVLVEKLDGAENGSMLFDLETLEPRYMLSVGEPGSSYTFEVAERVGFPKTLIERAKQKINRDKVNLNKLLAEVQQQKNKLNESIERAEHEEFLKKISKEKYDTLFKSWTEKLDRERERKIELARLAEYGRKYLRLMEDWNENEDRKQVIKRFIDGITAESKRKKELQKQGKREQFVEKKVARMKPLIQKGSKVRVLNGSEVGVVDSVKDEKVNITFGLVKMTVTMENLELVRE